ncbi:MAG TPA: alanine racemase [Solirubrobacteraceae bacterium]|jgi:alanine racemase|nr:alanine racemase [Solirubrobacteraceae bacterium]
MVRALARVNLAAIERNADRIRRELDPRVMLCAVVNANGYGHGALPAARAALAGGASWLAVATAVEAAELRAAGIRTPILVMGAISYEELPLALAADADVVAWSESFVSELSAAAFVRDRPVRVHVKLDTGMGRLGTRVSADALAVAEEVSSRRSLELVGAMTHFATADDPDDDFMQVQLARFEPFVAELRRRHPGIVAHAANSGAVFSEPGSHFDLVRCGIALYGLDPMQESAQARGLEPALELTSYVAAVKAAAPGDSAGYGRRFEAHRDTCLATLPIGYADGIRRAFTNNLDVLISGRRHPLVGAVSMDNITVELGQEASVEPGVRATIIGRNGSEHQSAEDLAARIDTINYEIVCGISARVPREYHRDGVPA